MIKKSKIFKIGVVLFFASRVNTTVTAQTEKEQDLQILKYNNPGLTVDLGVGLWAWPIPIDYDGGGDMDLLVSSQGKPVILYQSALGEIQYQ